MIRTELTLRLPNSPGALAQVLHQLAGEHVRILAMMLDPRGQMRFIADNPVRAAGVLRACHHTVTERDVLVATVGSDPTALAAATTLVSDAGGNLDYAYLGGTALGGGDTVVLGVEDAQRTAFRSGL